MTEPGPRRGLRGVLFRRSYAQVDAYAGAWEAANARALEAEGPLWLVLGDSASQGVGASAHDRAYVGLVLDRLRAADGRPWRVVNLSRSGARTREVVDAQWPRGQALGAELVTALVGGNDALGTPLPQWRRDVDELCAALPAGAVVGTTARGVRERKVRVANAHVRERAAAHGLRVADLWAHTGPPYRGLYADGFHPNDRGYVQWADALAEALGLPAQP
ncbi:MAG TPA: GDSL-type esterase/lipase family protein [Mycobacteriales bacterium]|nr:GDSL-type esterase/lipase family protein [Mycobacteriales bacterium]